ncbi:EAL domain-containing protein [Oricola sp.]|uniref:EAL domain-containing protein n=1 Tax=Oricola sp. TaxID=1979950 RepID=UPI0025D062AE|nr:EAL domain-containing protein [Oricola sp.]MCI5077870.1 EAL domain-containing protein [Oricola sp.]
MKRRAQRSKILVGATLLLLVFIAQSLSWLAPLDRFLADKRFSFQNRPVSGELVLVAIDKKSIDAVGVWPWPRQVHADITDRLRDAGAAEIVFDIDFSTPSDPAGDAAFAAALERAGGVVILPVFQQHSDAGSPTTDVEVTAPIDIFASNAWLGSVTVYPDEDGQVRVFPAGLLYDDAYIASIPGTLAGEEGRDVGIDFGIDAGAIETISAADILDGSFDPAEIAGKMVLVGAFATELRDVFAVPKLDQIAGVTLQALATETLLAGRNLVRIDPMTVAVPAFIALLILLVALRRQTPLQTVATFATIPVIAEVAAIVIYLHLGVMVPTAFVLVAALTALGAHSLAMTELFRTISREAQDDAHSLRQVLQQVVHDNFDAIVVTDESGQALQVSEAVRDVFDLGGALPRTGTAAAAFLPERIAADLAAAIAAARTGHVDVPRTSTAYILARDGSRRAVEYTIGISKVTHADPSTGPIVACLTARDVTDRLSYEAKLRRMSDYDDMTGTQRRHAFIDTVAAVMSGEEACGHAIVAFNLHRFKTVNIALGRDTGNMVLSAVADRLRGTDGHIRAVARLGGDTFAVLLADIADETAALAAADDIVHRISAPYPVAHGSAKVGVQAGVTLSQRIAGEAVDAEAMLDRAEMALDEARLSSGSKVVFFDSNLAAQRTRSRVIERDLWQALDRGEIHLAYQLQVSLSDHAPRGAEALLRWTHPELGIVAPDEFIGIAEANGFIGALGRFVLFTACREAAAWPLPISVAVNFAPQQFANNDIVDQVRQALSETGLDPARLTIELVESEFLETESTVLEHIMTLRALGVSIALDDFGTGYSSLGYLSNLRFDKIKIDKQFTRDLATNVETQGIIRSVAVLGEAFDMTIVCEGVETREQEALLRLIGCDEGQGYLYARPLDSMAFRVLIEEWAGFPGQRALA